MGSGPARSAVGLGGVRLRGPSAIRPGGWWFPRPLARFGQGQGYTASASKAGGAPGYRSLVVSPSSSVLEQREFDVRFEWGQEGARLLGPVSDIVIIVDVLRFTTAVSVAVDRGAAVFPYPWDDPSADAFAKDHGAILATRGAGRLSLSPTSLLHLSEGERLVLPSPNGSTCAVVAAEAGSAVVAGSLRNASAVARFARAPGRTVAVIAAGELWPGGQLRPAIEDLVGAGAILAGMRLGSLSPEARVAVAAFGAVSRDLLATISKCSSGRELAAKGWEEDLALASELDASDEVPILSGGAFVALAGTHGTERRGS